MRQATRVWLILTAITACGGWGVAWLQGADEIPVGLSVGVTVSLATFVAGKMVVGFLPIAREPLPRLMLATAVRMALPLAAVAVVAMTNRELLDKTFLAYFLPFQFITLIADTLGAIRRVETQVTDKA